MSSGRGSQNRNRSNWPSRPFDDANNRSETYDYRNRGSSSLSYDTRPNSSRLQGPAQTRNYPSSQRTHDDEVPPHRSAVDDERKAYAVNLQLNPVEMGIMARNEHREQEFKGLGAFNRYFGLLFSTDGFGYTVPDVWDGYFHITLAKFTSRLQPDALEEEFGRFTSRVGHIPHIPDIIFRASTIRKQSGANRCRGRQHIDFVVLPFDDSDELRTFHTQIQPLLEEIRQWSEASSWKSTRLNDLHVTIRKYSNISKDYDLSRIPMKRFPLRFRCSYLAVKQPREQAIMQHRRTPTYRWWDGATEIDGRCSACGTPVASTNWEGFCHECKDYETIRPVWLTVGGSPTLHRMQQEDTEEILSELVERVALNDS